MEYTLAAAAREEAGFEEMEEYIQRRQNMVAQFIATRLLLDMCKYTERTPGAQVEVRRWEKEVIYLAEARETEMLAAEAYKYGRGK